MIQFNLIKWRKPQLITLIGYTYDFKKFNFKSNFNNYILWHWLVHICEIFNVDFPNKYNIGHICEIWPRSAFSANVPKVLIFVCYFG